METYFNRLLFALLLILTMLSSVSLADEELNKLRRLAEEAEVRVAAQTIEPYEIEMIEWKRTLMGKPGLQLYVVFFNDMGQSVDYFVTDGKCSSSGKRLLSGWQFIRAQTGTNSDGSVYGDFVVPTPDLDGTSGNSDSYVYCKTVDGKYKQWNGRYYISDYPIELTIKPLVIDTSGKNQQQQ